jgi:heme-degrading monooxygenase HmoA
VTAINFNHLVNYGGLYMILEVAILDVRPGADKEFEIAFREASAIISSTPGYVSHELHNISP